VEFVIATVGQAREELLREGLEFASSLPLGVMIEVAAATVMVESWATQVDFFALGTNDLIASALGIDRDDPIGATKNDPLHPGLLRMVHGVIAAAHKAGRRVTACGEMASDPEGTRALAALEVDSLSVAVNQLSRVRQTLATLAGERITSLSSELTRLRSADEVRQVLRSRSRSIPEEVGPQSSDVVAPVPAVAVV
jgi:phosphoenolpyruvate-protein kinase (PTS system EI component)